MAAGSRTRRLELDPAVAACRVAPAFALADDLDHLLAVRRCGALEAAVLYQSRILDALAGAAVAAIGLRVSPSVFSNLETLRWYALLPETTLELAHAQRRLGNAARHLHRVIPLPEVEVGMAVTEAWLEWFFCAFPLGPRRPCLWVGSGGRLAPPDLSRLVAALDGPSLVGSMDALERVGSATLLTLASERLLARRMHRRARAAAERALALDPDSLRAAQLLGLCDSRAAQASRLDGSRRRLLEAALATLEPLRRRDPNDEETLGILAGAHKRIWRTSGDRERLAESCRTYSHGWQASRGSSSYLGVNAAATALWLGETERARRVAGEVRRLLAERGEAIARMGTGGAVDGLWDRATRAECELLLGDHRVAAELYRSTLSAWPDRGGELDAVLAQLERHLEVLGLPGPAREWLARGD